MKLLKYLLLLVASPCLAATVLFSDNFGLQSNGTWNVYQGAWIRSTNELNGSGTSQTGGYYYLSTNSSSFANCAVEAQIEPGLWGAGVVGRLNPTTGSGYSAWVYNSGVLSIERYDNWFNTWRQLATTTVATAYVLNTNFHTIKLQMNGAAISAYFDGVHKLTVRDTTYTNGTVGVTFWTGNNAVTHASYANFNVYAISNAPSIPRAYVTVSWLPATGAISNYLYATTSVSNPNWYLLGQYGPTVTSTQVVITNNNQLFFKVYSLTPTQVVTNVPHSIQLGWDAEQNPYVSTYKVAYGPSSGHYTASQVANGTTATINNLVSGNTYYSAVAAIASYTDNVSTQAVQGAYSTEVSYTVPVATTNGPNVLVQDPINVR